MRLNFIAFCTSVVLFSFSAVAQDDFPYDFKITKENSKTSVKDQCATGTCWSYATISFIESELMRMGKGEHDLSEMYNVRMTYPKKAEQYMRYQGKHQFSAGSLSHDVINVIGEYGAVPNEVYSGLPNGGNYHNHGEMDAVLEGMMKALIKQKKPSPQWDDAIGAVLDTYLGEVPENFDYQGKNYTPKSFATTLGLEASNYVSLTSFAHHPFYEEFSLEVPDNFSGGRFYNLPLDELMAALDNAIDKGYTVSWDADVSEKTFSFRNGMAILPEKGVDKEKIFKAVVPEMKVTQANRQEAFDNYLTTDDHLMHLTGKAKDQDGNVYYIIKNSWGDKNRFGGIQYISEAYVRMKTVGILLHKEALPKGTKSKMATAQVSKKK